MAWSPISFKSDKSKKIQENNFLQDLEDVGSFPKKATSI